MEEKVEIKRELLGELLDIMEKLGWNQYGFESKWKRDANYVYREVKSVYNGKKTFA